jgi:hypothetical protein
MAKILKIAKPDREEENVLTLCDATEVGASQDEIARWLQFADIALNRNREYEEAA